jgi:hypothetical protein
MFPMQRWWWLFEKKSSILKSAKMTVGRGKSENFTSASEEVGRAKKFSARCGGEKNYNLILQ